MIVVRLQGGLSNQIFQYATARSLALKRRTRLKIDTTWYDQVDQSDGVGVRKYELGCFKLPQKFYTGAFPDRLANKIFGLTYFSDDDSPYTFHPELLGLRGNVQLLGFFQNQRYFKDIRPQLLKDLSYLSHPTGKNIEMLRRIGKDKSSVSIHVRRGDYAHSIKHNATHGLKGKEYYDKALKVITKRLPRPNFYVFSDEPEWCKNNLKFEYPTTYIDWNTEGAEDMRLMRSCRHNILANSSFSWWGAWLNENPDKIVIAPRIWVNDPALDTSDLLPPEWIAI